MEGSSHDDLSAQPFQKSRYCETADQLKTARVATILYTVCVNAQFNNLNLFVVSPFIHRKTNNIVKEIQSILLPSFACLLLNYVATEPITVYIFIES